MTKEHCGNMFTMILYLIDAANTGNTMIGVLSEDTYVFILFVFVCVSRGDGLPGADGAVGCSNAGPQCLQ